MCISELFGFEIVREYQGVHREEPNGDVFPLGVNQRGDWPEAIGKRS